MPHHLFSFSSSNSSACVDARARRHSSLVLASDTRGSNISGARQGTCSCGRVVTGSQAVAGWAGEDSSDFTGIRWAVRQVWAQSGGAKLGNSIFVLVIAVLTLYLGREWCFKQRVPKPVADTGGSSDSDSGPGPDFGNPRDPVKAGVLRPSVLGKGKRRPWTILTSRWTYPTHKCWLSIRMTPTESHTTTGSCSTNYHLDVGCVWHPITSYRFLIWRRSGMKFWAGVLVFLNIWCWLMWFTVLILWLGMNWRVFAAGPKPWT